MVINVLHVVSALNPGGLERVVLSLLDRPGKLGSSYVVCLREGGSWAERVPWDRIWVGSRGSIAGAVKAITDCAKRWDIGVIQSHNPVPHLPAVLAGVITGIPVVHTKHGRNYVNNRKRVWLNRQLARFSAKIVAVSEDVAEVATNIEHVPCSKVRVICNGINMAEWQPYESARKSAIRDKLGIPAQAVLVGSVGRISAEKRYGWLVRRFAALVDDPTSFGLRFAIVGDGPEESLVRDAADKEGVGPLCFFPGMSDTIDDWLGAMDVFCLSSRSEGTSITLLEAGAMGLPAVVTDVGGNREVVKNGVTGIVVPPNDEKGFSEALRRLSLDEDLRKRMGAAARERIARLYSLDRMMEQYEEMYAEVVNQGQIR